MARVNGPVIARPASASPIVVLLVGTMLAAVAGSALDAFVDAEVRDRAEERADRAAAVIELQLARYAATAQAAAALDPDRLTQSEWEEHVDRLDLGRDLPSLYSVNTARLVTPSGLAAYERAQRDESIGDFAVHPPLDDPAARPRLVVIDRVSPIGPNRAAIGFDVLSNADAAPAVLRAVDEAKPSLSDALTLVQEPGEQTGLVLYSPWFGDDGAVAGVANVVLRGQDFLDALAPQLGGLGVSVTDATADGDRVIGALVPPGGVLRDLASDRTVAMYGQQWQVVVEPQVGFASWTERWAGLLTGLGVLAVAVLGAALLGAVRQRGDHAEREVAERTAELVEANDRLARANAAKDRFLAVIGHEFRTPLTVIRGFAATATAGRLGELDPRQEQMLERIDAQARRLDGLVDDLLIAARLQAGEVRVRPERIELQPLLTRLAHEHADTVHRVTCRPEEAVFADPTHLVRVLVALLRNAEQYGRPPVELVAAVVGDQVVLRVRDHGDGIPHELAARVFEPFQQADEDDTRHARGVGLGLAIVRQLCRYNNGTVQLAPVDTGTCVELRFPRACPPEELSPPAGREPLAAPLASRVAADDEGR